MGKCKNCKWWGKRYNGVCHLLSGADENAKGLVSNDAIIVVWAADDHGLDAHLATGPDFGCSLFRSKK